MFATSLVAAGVLASVFVALHAAGNPLAGSALYLNVTHNPAADQANLWRISRPADAAQLDKIATRPTAYWTGDWVGNPAQATTDYTSRAAAAGAVGMIVAYNIPGRDCGNYSLGGAVDGTAYRNWSSAVASGLGGRKTIIVLEPDALGLLTNCLTAAQQTERLAMMTDAVKKYQLNGGLVYIDTSMWIAPAEMARRLQLAGIAAASGFSVNTSAFNDTATATSYADQVSQALGGGVHYVIDSSRNGLGGNGEWCNPLGRALGNSPTTSTGNILLDAYLWIKYPGESDGTCNGGPGAGSWWPDYALGLAQRSSLGVLAPTAAPAPVVTPTPVSALVALGPGTYNDNQFNYLGTWFAGDATGGANVIVDKYLADDHYSNETNASYQVKFNGSQAQIYSTQDASHGQMAFRVDGGPETIVDGYAATRRDQVLVYSTPIVPTGEHVLTARIMGTKNLVSSGTYGNADRLVVLAATATVVTPAPTPIPPPAVIATPVPTAVQGAGSLNDSLFSYAGPWQLGTGTAKYNADDHYTQTAGAMYSLTFTGTQAKLYGAQAPIHGQAAVSIDGGAPVTIDQYALTRQDQVLLYTSPVLTSGTHTILVRALGTKNAASSDTWINADRIDVVPGTIGDINVDGRVNVIDLSVMLSHWSTPDPPSDLNRDTTVNILDMSILLTHWQ